MTSRIKTVDIISKITREVKLKKNCSRYEKILKGTIKRNNRNKIKHISQVNTMIGINLHFESQILVLG